MNRTELTHEDLLVVTRGGGGTITTREIVRVTAPRDDSSPMTDMTQPPYCKVQPINGGPEFDLYDEGVDRDSIRMLVCAEGEAVTL